MRHSGNTSQWANKGLNVVSNDNLLIMNKAFVNGLLNWNRPLEFSNINIHAAARVCAIYQWSAAFIVVGYAYKTASSF